MSHTIRVRILNREYSLLVRRQDEALTHELAEYVDSKMREFRRAHPEQPEITAAIITALALAEELFSEREEHDRFKQLLNSELKGLTDTLGEALLVNGKENGSANP
jgi:cell division protein ZapA